VLVVVYIYNLDRKSGGDQLDRLFVVLFFCGIVLGRRYGYYWFIIRFIFLKRELVFNSVKEAFRQSFLFSFFIIIILLLLSRNLFSWMNLIFLVAGLSVLEFFLLSYAHNIKQ